MSRSTAIDGHGGWHNRCNGQRYDEPAEFYDPTADFHVKFVAMNVRLAINPPPFIQWKIKPMNVVRYDR